MKKQTKQAEEDKRFWIIFLIVVGILGFIIFLINLIQIPYSISVGYTEREAYNDIEFYTEQISANGCDNSYGCYCIHYQKFLFFDTYNCETCNCDRERTITRYRDIQKYREEIRYCALINRIVGYC